MNVDQQIQQIEDNQDPFDQEHGLYIEEEEPDEDY